MDDCCACIDFFGMHVLILIATDQKERTETSQRRSRGFFLDCAARNLVNFPVNLLVGRRTIAHNTANTTCEFSSQSSGGTPNNSAQHGKHKAQLFLTHVRSVLTYGAELWGPGHLLQRETQAGTDKVEVMYREFLRRELGVSKKTHNLITYAEFGAFPTRHFI
jgi:hypothetical protein